MAERNQPRKRTVVVFSGAKNKYIIDLKTRPTGDYTLLEGPATAMMKELADRLMSE